MKFKLVLLLAITVLCGACASSKYKSPYRQYAWHGFENKYYQFVKNRTEASELEYHDRIDAILSSRKKGKTKRVPPGIYAEKGMILVKSGHPDVAIRYFKKEADLYPESKVLMEHLIYRYEKQ